jgi:hypothetical protein
MPTFHEELKRRIEQFRHYLELMRKRRGELTKGNCFIIFQERPDGDDSNSKQLTDSKSLVYQSTLEVAGWDTTSTLDENIVIDLPNEGWRGDNSQFRFIQFSFNQKYFDLDIPNTTLYRAEAEIILRRRTGFFYVLEHRQFEHPAENADRFNPLRKVFVYGDDRCAAEDMAYVVFNVWKFPVDWRFYVTAAAFCEKTNWEKGFPIE